MPESRQQEPVLASGREEQVKQSSSGPPAAPAEPQVAAKVEEPTAVTGPLRVSQPKPEILPPLALASHSCGQDRIAIKELAQCVWREIDVDNLPGLAAQASYYFVLALFPFLIFLLYIRHLTSFNRRYGALSAFVILMLWMYVTSFILLVSAEINCEVRKMRASLRCDAG